MREIANVESVEKGEKVVGYIEVAEMMDLRVQIPLAIIRSNNDGPTLNVHGGIHGNEYEGMYAIIRLISESSPENLKCGTLILTPVVNTLAFSWVMRQNPMDSKDLARSFPGTPSGTVSQAIAYTFFNKVVKRSDYVIGLHSAGEALRILPFTEFFDAEGRMGEESLAMAKAFGIRYLRRMRARPEATVTCTLKAVGEGIPAIEPEIGGEERCNPENAEVYINGVKNVMRHLGMLAGRTESPLSFSYFDGKWVSFGKGGFFMPTAKLGQEVNKEDQIAILHDWFGNKEPVRASVSGTVLGIRTLPALRPGETIAHIGKVYKVEGGNW